MQFVPSDSHPRPTSCMQDALKLRAGSQLTPAFCAVINTQPRLDCKTVLAWEGSICNHSYFTQTHNFHFTATNNHIMDFFLVGANKRKSLPLLTLMMMLPRRMMMIVSLMILMSCYNKLNISYPPTQTTTQTQPTQTTAHNHQLPQGRRNNCSHYQSHKQKGEQSSLFWMLKPLAHKGILTGSLNLPWLQLRKSFLVLVVPPLG